ncbi:MAG: hypothetical protein HRU38_12300 [Saccharospirillaceae bacterium]|nr:hypothetical protein [Pseudomonadales bacterium]NRB79429.1 hypothetical protein [Saccharospirillaceae bacterium]
MTFCKSRCTTQTERLEVYTALLLRSMFTNDQDLARLAPEVLTELEAKTIIAQYNLKPEPIVIIKK